MESNAPARTSLILCDIRSAENVGSLFRTADAVGIDTVYLCGITPSPVDRFGRPVQAIAKTALGAEKTLSWQHTTDLPALLESLKQQGVSLIAVEQSPRAVDYKNIPVSFPVAFLLGSEVDGLPESILSYMDAIAEIPMKGEKESLNVAVAGGIALFRFLDR